MQLGGITNIMLYSKNIVDQAVFYIVDNINALFLLKRDRKIMRNFVNVSFMLVQAQFMILRTSKVFRLANTIKIDC